MKQRTDIVTPGSGGISVERLPPEWGTGNRGVIGEGDGMPSNRRRKRVVVLLVHSPVAHLRIIDTPCENIVSCECGLRRTRDGSIGSPVDNRDDPVRSHGGDSSFVPVVLHFNFELDAD